MTTTNAYGFPTELCSRCKGTGEHSYNQRFGRVCFKCDGNRYVVTKKAFDAWSSYLDAVELATKPQGKHLVEGDLIAHNKKWRKVVSIETTEIATGWNITYTSDGTKVSTPCTWKMFVTLEATADLPQEKITVGTNQLLRRRGKQIDPTPYINNIGLTTKAGECWKLCRITSAR